MINAVDPGAVNTGIMSNFFFPLNKIIDFGKSVFLKSPRKGAETVVYCAVSPAVLRGGMMWGDCKPIESSEQSRDEAIAKKLYELTEKTLNL